MEWKICAISENSYANSKNGMFWIYEDMGRFNLFDVRNDGSEKHVGSCATLEDAKKEGDKIERLEN